MRDYLIALLGVSLTLNVALAGLYWVERQSRKAYRQAWVGVIHQLDANGSLAAQLRRACRSRAETERMQEEESCPQ